MIYLANDKYYAELTQEYQPGDSIIYVNSVPTNVPTILVAAKGTSNETVFVVTTKTLNSLNGVTRLKGANVELLIQTPITCLNNEEFINQYRSYLGIDWKGEWDNATVYEVGDGVSYNNTSYVSLVAGSNHLPTDTDYWQVVGIQGVQGEQGEPGVDGLGVPAGGTTGQVLAKKTDNDNDTEWVKAGSGDFLVTQVFS